MDRYLAAKKALRCKAGVHSITTQGWYGTVQASLTRTVNGRHVIVNGHARVEAARLGNLTHVPVEFVDMPEYQEQQLSVALDSPYGHWDQAKLATRLHGLEVQHLDMDALCLPPFDVSRILQKPLPDAFGLAKTAAGLQNIAPVSGQQDAKRPPQEGERPPVVRDNDRGATGTARRDAGYTLTLTVTATDELLDMLVDVHAAAKLWRDNGLEVVIGE